MIYLGLQVAHQEAEKNIVECSQEGVKRVIRLYFPARNQEQPRVLCMQGSIFEKRNRLEAKGRQEDWLEEIAASPKIKSRLTIPA